MSGADEDSRARFREAMRLVDLALDALPGERDAILERECDDPAVRREAARLLEADAKRDRLLSRAAGDALPEAFGAFAKERAAPGMRFGPFRLVSPIGRGGMGEVWLAEREGDFEQTVAVKLLYAAKGDEAAAARFRRERQILAKLAHPRIARLLDGGVTAEGRPWIAMERVDGLPLVEHCSRAALDVDARLRLFVEVCDAVQFAHRNLVVHRDLKPSNVLVDGDGAPKLLDFGIAKVLEEDDRELTALTSAGETPMTPDYASPEQVSGEPITTASDVWSLGAILHELVTGSRVDRKLIDTTKGRPSARVTEGDRTPTIGALSGNALATRLKGDLDAIVLKALRPDPKDRYASVDALAADVRRHLAGLPVTARGDAASYLLRATLRRHRAAVAATLIVLSAVLVGLGSTLWQAHRARDEARKAEEAEAFLVDMLRSFDPQKGNGHVQTQADILERGEARLGESLADQPLEQARLLRVFAETWLDLERSDRALASALRALEIERSMLGPRDIEIAKTLVVLGDVQARRGDRSAAADAEQQAMDIATEAEGPNGPTVATATSNLGRERCYESDFAEGQRLERRAVDISRQVHGEEAPETLDRYNDLAICLGDEGQYGKSAEINARIAATSERVLGPTHPATRLVRHNYARDLIALGRCTEAEAILRDVLAMQVEAVGNQIGGMERMLGLALECEGRHAEALTLFDDAVNAYAKVGDPTMVAISLTSKAEALRHVGRLDEAESAAREALATFPEHGPDDRWVARIEAELGAVLLDERRPDEARDALAPAVALLEKKVPLQTYTKTARADLDRATALIANEDAGSKGAQKK